jgi:hypothetical protein
MDKKTTNNDLQSTTTQKTKDRAKRTPLKTGGELECSERVSSSALIFQEELDRLNLCSAEINKLENEIDVSINS